MGEIIFLAVPYENVEDAAKELGSFADGKILLDVTNAVGDNMDRSWAIQRQPLKSCRNCYPERES